MGHDRRRAVPPRERAKLNIKDKRGFTPLDTALGLAGGFGFDGKAGVAHEETAKVIRELGGVPGTPVPGPPARRDRNQDDPQEETGTKLAKFKGQSRKNVVKFPCVKKVRREPDTPWQQNHNPPTKRALRAALELATC